MKDRLGFAILTVLPLFASIIDSRVCIGHFVQGEWPPHEMFHLLMGLAGLLTAYGLILVLVRIPLRRGERWAWFSIAGAAVAVHGGQLLSDILTDGGLRNQAPILGNGSLIFGGIVVVLILYGVGLALTWPSGRHT